MSSAVGATAPAAAAAAAMAMAEERAGQASVLRGEREEREAWRRAAEAEYELALEEVGGWVGGWVGGISILG